MKRLLPFLLLSVGLGVLGLWLATRDALLDPATYQFTNTSPWLIGAGIVALVLWWFAPTARLRILAGFQGEKLSWLNAALAHVAQVFGVAMTPSGTGGSPAMLVVFERAKLPLGVALGIVVQVFIIDLAALAIMIFVGTTYLVFFSNIPLETNFLALAVVAGAVALAVAVLLIRFPGAIYTLVRFIKKWRILARFRSKLTRIGREYLRSSAVFQSLKFSQWCGILGTNITGWAASFVLFWVLLLMFGATAELFSIVALLSIITLFGFFVPTPGGAGFYELTVGLATGTGDGASSAAIAGATVLWRLVTFYVIYLLGPIGGWILFARWKGKQQERSTER